MHTSDHLHSNNAKEQTHTSREPLQIDSQDSYTGIIEHPSISSTLGLQKDIKKSDTSSFDLHYNLENNDSTTPSSSDDVEHAKDESYIVNDTKNYIFEAFRFLNEYEIYKAESVIRNARIEFPNDKELKTMYATITYWLKKVENIKSISGSMPKGDQLMLYWYEFKKNQENAAILQTDGYTLSVEQLSCFRYFVISLAHACYQNELHQQPALKNSLHFQLKNYRCLKLLGEIKECLHIIHAMCQKEHTTMLLCELADCYYLSKDYNKSKLFFREAFFFNPSEINLANIESSYVSELEKLIKAEKRYAHHVVNHWIPVYGYVYKIFNVVRELKPVEFHTIQNEISNIEAKLGDHTALGHDDPTILLPALLNKYFWIMEHYKHDERLDNVKKEEYIQVLYNKIKHIDSHIHKLLTNT